MHLSGGSQGCFCLLLHLMQRLHMQHVFGRRNRSTARRDILQSAPTSSWEASGAQQQLQQQQQQQQPDDDLTALLGELQQAQPAQEGRDAQEQPEVACVPQQSLPSLQQLATVRLMHPVHWCVMLAPSWYIPNCSAADAHPDPNTERMSYNADPIKVPEDITV